MKNKYSVSLIVFLLITTLSIFLLGFNSKDKGIPQEVYNVYLDGSLIGTIESKDSFKEFINAKEEVNVLYCGIFIIFISYTVLVLSL